MATPDWVEKELRESFKSASRAGRKATRTEARAAKASYMARERALEITFTNGALLRVPVRLVPELAHAAPRDLRAVEVLGRGGGLHWESLDLDIGVPALVSSLFEGRSWMAELGRMGGRRSSTAKAAAARRNGRKGGRPRSRVHPGTLA